MTKCVCVFLLPADPALQPGRPLDARQERRLPTAVRPQPRSTPAGEVSCLVQVKSCRTLIVKVTLPCMKLPPSFRHSAAPPAAVVLFVAAAAWCATGWCAARWRCRTARGSWSSRSVWVALWYRAAGGNQQCTTRDTLLLHMYAAEHSKSMVSHHRCCSMPHAHQHTNILRSCTATTPSKSRTRQ